MLFLSILVNCYLYYYETAFMKALPSLEILINLTTCAYYNVVIPILSNEILK